MSGTYYLSLLVYIDYASTSLCRPQLCKLQKDHLCWLAVGFSMPTNHDSSIYVDIIIPLVNCRSKAREIMRQAKHGKELRQLRETRQRALA